MLRRILAIIAIASLIVCLTASAMWIRSYRHSDLFVLRRRVVDPTTGRIEAYIAISEKGFLVIGRASGVPGNLAWNTIVTAHCLFIVFPAGLIPVYWLMWRFFARQNKRLALGLCLHCGYDLRASESRCPECGRRIDVVSGPRFHSRRHEPESVTIRPSLRFMTAVACGLSALVFVVFVVLAFVGRWFPIGSRSLRDETAGQILLASTGIALLLGGFIYALLLLLRLHRWVLTPDGIEVCGPSRPAFLVPWPQVRDLDCKRGIRLKGPESIRIQLPCVSAPDIALILARWQAWTYAPQPTDRTRSQSDQSPNAFDNSQPIC